MLRTIVLGLAFGLVLPSMVDAAWTRVQLKDGSQVCQDDATHVQYPAPYRTKAAAANWCTNTFAPIIAWAGTAAAAPVLTSTICNPDHTCDTSYPADAKNNATVAWNDATLATAMSVVVAQNMGTATDINLSTYCTGTGCAAATYTIVTAQSGWSIGGSGSSHLLSAGSSAGSGSLTLRVTNGASTDVSAVAFPWSYVVPPVSAVRVRAGYYEDCYSWMPHGGDFNIFIGSDGYLAVKSCIDFAAANSPEKGVFVPILWASLEGDTAGCFDSTCSNGLASAGKIGFALFDDLLNYAQSKHVTIFFEWDWFNYYSDPDCTVTHQDNSPNGAYTIRGSVPKYLLPTSCGGTDSGNVYGGGVYRPGFSGGQDSYYLKLWDTDVGDRMIAVLNAYAARYDSNTALEGFILFGEEGDAAGAGIPYDGSVPGYSFDLIDAQFRRIALATKPNWTHTNIVMASAWMRGVDETLAQSALATNTAIGVQVNNTATDMSFGDRGYLGVPDGFGAVTSTHNYRSELPFMIWTATQFEICPSLARGGLAGLSSEAWYDLYMNTGKADSGGRPNKPVWWVTGANKLGSAYCPSEATGNWGTIGGSGWYHAIQTQPLNMTCPTKYAGGCTTTAP